MSATEAISVAEREMSRRPDLRIVAVAGPGEPLFNTATFEVMAGLRNNGHDPHFCLSTNGVLLADCVEQLVDSGIETISVSMSTSIPATAAMTYEWASIRGKRMMGLDMGREIIEAQIAGIEEAADVGIHVKVNSVLIPGVNETGLSALAETVASAGAELQNIIPLVPCGTMSECRAPSPSELKQARADAEKHIKQFSHCHQCRADVVGIPGADTIL